MASPALPGLLALYSAAVLAEGAVPPPALWGWTALAALGGAATVGAIGRLVGGGAGTPGLAGGDPDGAAPRGRPRSAARSFAMAVAGALALMIAAGQLNRLSLWLSPVPVAAWLAFAQSRSGDGSPGLAGAAAAALPLAGWVAARGVLEPPAWLLAAAAGLWVGAWQAGEGRGARWAHAGAVALWVAAGWASGRGGWYFGAVALAAALLAAHHLAGAEGQAGGGRPTWALSVHAAIGCAILAGCLLDVARSP
ncbi:MAG TPA: hypothetical protein VIK90_01465 [Limnochordales bacterium]